MSEISARDSRRRIGRSPSATNWRVLAGVAASLSAVLATVALAGYLVDSSPLADLADPLAVQRDVSYGPGAHHVLDIAYDRALARLRPAIVMIHPGGWMQGDKAAYHGLMADYARLGYVTVSINFRPSGVAKYPAAIEDCKRAIRWLRFHAATYGVDPKRIGVTGWSSGAHLAMLLALSDDSFEKDDEFQGVSGRVQAAICVSGVYDFLMERRGRFPNSEEDLAVVRFLGGSPLQNRDLARRASPLTYLSPDDPPVLVFHGELDPRIDAEQARQFASASKAMGREDPVVLLPNEGHGRNVLPEDPQSRQLIRDFFARHLGVAE